MGDRMISVVAFLVAGKIMIGIWGIVVGMAVEINKERNDLAQLVNLLQEHYGDKNE